MNERIKELAVESGLYVDLMGEPWPRAMSAEESELAYEKFAELIVQECANVVEKNLFADIGWNTSKAVKRHFGIGLEE